MSRNLKVPVVSMEHNSPKYMPSQALSGARTGLAMDSDFFFLLATMRFSLLPYLNF